MFDMIDVEFEKAIEEHNGDAASALISIIEKDIKEMEEKYGEEEAEDFKQGAKDFETLALMCEELIATENYLNELMWNCSICEN